MRLNERPPVTNITKAAQDALEALEEIHAGKRHPQLALAVAQQLRAALQDKAGEVADFQSRCMFVARLENMQANGDTWLTIPAVLALINDCDMLASTELSAQPAPVVPDDVVRYRTIRDGLVYIEPHESGEIYVAGETGVYTKSGDEFDAAVDAIAASQKKG